MHRPHPPVPRPAPVYLEAPSLARAKRTDRTEARRRHRAEQAATIDPVEDDEAPASGGTSAKAAKAAAPAAAAAPRPSFVAAFKNAFRPVDLRADLRSLPTILTHWGLLAALAATLVSTAVFILTTNEFASSLDLTLSDPAAGKPIGTISNISYIAVSLFVAPPPAAGAFLVGFTAPRASWLGGLIYGLVAAGCYSVILLSPTGRLFIGANAAPAVRRQRLDRRPARRDVLRLGVGLVQAVPQPGQPEPRQAAAEARGEGPWQRASELARDGSLLAHPAQARVPDLAHAGR